MTTTPHFKGLIQLEIQNKHNFPIPIKTINNVWCCSLLSGKYFLLMNKE